MRSLLVVTCGALALSLSFACGKEDSAAGGDDAGPHVPGEGGPIALPNTGASVLEFHNHASRDGLYVDAAFTKAAAASLKIDTAFSASLDGPAYAQPLFVEAGVGGKDAVIVATQHNKVYALDAATGALLWPNVVSLGASVSRASLPCGNIDSIGVTGTPYIDLAARAIYLDAMTPNDAGLPPKHLLYALSLDDGSVKSGWPIDVGGALGSRFDAKVQSQRGALAMLGGKVYVGYGGLWGDCGDYHGWVVSVDPANPSSLTGWQTTTGRGGIWAVGGLASDGSAIYATTGNTDSPSSWQQGNAVLRFTASNPTFAGNTSDYYAPSNWRDLDNADLDLGGASAVPVDLPSGSVSHVVVALGKDGNAYLLDRTNLGGIGGELAKTTVTTTEILGAAAAYRTSTASYVVFRGRGSACTNHGTGDLVAITIQPGSPPSIASSWCSTSGGLGSPMVTTTDGTSDAIVWSASNSALIGIDGDTGAVVFNGGGNAAALTGGTQYFNSPIAAKGRIYVAGKTRVFAFKM